MEKVIQRRRMERLRVVEAAKHWAQALPGPLTAILVGSYARGDFNAWSDVDVILISPRFRGLRVPERLIAVDAPPGYEVVAWTPEEFEEMLSRRNPLAVEAVVHGVVLRDDLGLARAARQRNTIAG
ncbi:nucleotidyltransferase domain-containing protein [Pyrodictium abyssi]|uniref:Nucleotidyltransferase domain-containing protein n=1 Tax=Pyrodictium abyssi TaxID=54256 RepID=A0ABM8IVP2_9CREN|nr:nucleotidyltransferase domain-containing protein [Pyrodictium abyssi]